MTSTRFIAKAGFITLSVLGAASLFASTAHAGDAASASGSAVVTTTSGRIISVSGEVVSPFSNFTAVVVTPTYTTDAADATVVTSITSLNVAPTAADVTGGEADALLDSVYGATSPLPVDTTDDTRLSILRSMVAGGALD